MPKLLALLVALAAALPATAAAQMTATVVQINGALTRQATDLDLDTPPVSGTDCARASIDIELNGTDTTQTIIDVWRGSDCNNTTQRAGMATNECTHLTLTGQDLNINNRMEINLTAVPFTELLEDCTLGDGRHDVWFLATNTTMSNQEVTSYASVPIQLDGTAPAAPINASGGSGGSQIRVDWEGGNSMGDASDHKSYVVYGDPNSETMGSGCTGATTSIVPGEPVPTGLTELSRGPGSEATVNPADLGVEDGNSAYVVIVEVDQAGNESVASELVCISRVPTTGFCDAYGENCKSCSVGGGPGIPGRKAPLVAALFVLALAGASRRWSRR